MFISENLQVSTTNTFGGKYHYDVYHTRDKYYMTDRFELCSLEQNKYIFNHTNGFIKLADNNRHELIFNNNIKKLLKKSESNPVYIIQKMSPETDKNWETINTKRLGLKNILTNSI